MPIETVRPSGPGDLFQWTSVNVSGPALLNWQAVSTLSSNQWTAATSAGLADRHAVPPLPVDATDVSVITLFALVAGDGAASMRLALRLSGVDSFGAAIVPLEGGYQLVSAEFTVAPGALAWTVARWNAAQVGYDSLDDAADPALALSVDEIWASVVYAASTPDAVDLPPLAVRFPAPIERLSLPTRDALPAFLPDVPQRIEFPTQDPLDIALPVRIERRVSYDGGD